MYNDQRDDQQGIKSATEGPDILPDEVEYAINQLKNGKAPGPDEILEGYEAAGCRGTQKADKDTKILLYTSAFKSNFLRIGCHQACYYTQEAQH